MGVIGGLGREVETSRWYGKAAEADYGIEISEVHIEAGCATICSIPTFYLAMPIISYRLLFVTKPIGELFEDDLKLVVFNPDTEEIVEWIPPIITEPLSNK